MSVEEKLTAVREASAKRLPPELRATMLDATERLRGSGILDRVIRPGMKAPGFTLNDQDGQPVRPAGVRRGRAERVPRLLVTVLPA